MDLGSDLIPTTFYFVRPWENYLACLSLHSLIYKVRLIIHPSPAGWEDSRHNICTSAYPCPCASPGISHSISFDFPKAGLVSVMANIGCSCPPLPPPEPEDRANQLWHSSLLSLKIHLHTALPEAERSLRAGIWNKTYLPSWPISHSSLPCL